MDSDRLEMTPFEGLRAVWQARRLPRQQPRFPGDASDMGEHVIRRRLAQAEQFIRQQDPTTALALLRAPGVPPTAWPEPWNPRWSALVGWALLQQHQPVAASGVL